jgi:ATP-dependent DNA helicase PIF1
MAELICICGDYCIRNCMLDEDQHLSLPRGSRQYTIHYETNPIEKVEEFQAKHNFEIFAIEAYGTGRINLYEVPDKFMLSFEQEAPIQAALQGESIFLTGSAGTGKTFTLHHLIKRLAQHYPIAVVAPTGVAAIQVGGTTIHSWAGLGLIKKGEFPKNFKTELWKQIKVFVIDEISMVSDWLLNLLDQMGRKARQIDAPFGGLQVIFCGDFLQLPPIEGSFCFKSEAWNQAISKCFSLQHVYRQGSDAEFAEILNAIRTGTASSDQLALLQQQGETAAIDQDIQPTILYPLRSSVELENLAKLEALPGEIYQFVAQDSGIASYFEEKKVCSWTNAPTILKLKIGAQVVLLRNLDIPGKLVNGSRGIIVGFDGSNPFVRFACGITKSIQRCTWTIKRNNDQTIICATRHQFPLDLAWALTLHKSQGMSLDCVQTDLSGCFAPGMAYVALSRCRSRSGLKVTGLIAKSIRVDRDALEFHQRIEEKQRNAKKRRK